MKKTILAFLLILSGIPLHADNNGPYFTSDTLVFVEENGLFNYYVSANDEDAEDSLFFMIPEKPDWLEFTDLKNDSALLTGIMPQHTGDEWVEISVSDGIDTVAQIFHFTLLCPNCGPFFITEPILFVNADEEYICIFEVTDCDMDAQIIVDSIPDWLSYDDSGGSSLILHGTPALSDTGYHFVLLSVERVGSLCPSPAQMSFYIEVRNPVGIHWLQTAAGFSVYPNPFRDRLFLVHDPWTAESRLEIIGARGEILLSKGIRSSDEEVILDLNFLPPGIYYFRIRNESGTWVQKIRKQGIPLF